MKEDAFQLFSAYESRVYQPQAVRFGEAVAIFDHISRRRPLQTETGGSLKELSTPFRLLKPSLPEIPFRAGFTNHGSEWHLVLRTDTRAMKEQKLARETLANIGRFELIPSVREQLFSLGVMVQGPDGREWYGRRDEDKLCDGKLEFALFQRRGDPVKILPLRSSLLNSDELKQYFVTFQTLPYDHTTVQLQEKTGTDDLSLFRDALQDIDFNL